MGLKKQLGMGIISASLGLSLVGTGTFAYFSDTEVTNNTFAAGTLDLSTDPTAVIDVGNIKPGDSMLRKFKLTNNGSLDIKAVKLLTEYSVVDKAGDNASNDFGKHIRVNFMWNWGKKSEPIFETTLYELGEMDPDVVKREVWDPLWKKKSGLKPGETNELWVEFEFVDNGEAQNVFQGDKLNLEWTFNAKQTEGEKK